MKPFVIVCDGMDNGLFDKLCSSSDFNVHKANKVKRDELIKIISSAHALIIRSATIVDDELLKHAKELKYIIRAGEGTDNIDKDICKKRDIKISNTPGANSNSAAEHAIALMFTIMRKTAFAHNTMTKGGWDKSKFTGVELANKTVGIMGFGKIGKTVAKRLSGFDTKILFYDPVVKEDKAATKVSELSLLFKQSDIITIHAPCIEQTQNAVDAEILSNMKETAFLINASRGGIVDEQALYKALKQNKIAGAALDVYGREPLDKNSALRELPNLVLTPHLGAATYDAQLRVGEMAILQLREFFINNNLINEVIQ